MGPSPLNLIHTLTDFGVYLLSTVDTASAGKKYFAINIAELLSSTEDKKTSAKKILLEKEPETKSTLFMFQFDQHQTPVAVYQAYWTSHYKNEITVQDGAPNLMMEPTYKKWFEELEGLRDRIADSEVHARMKNPALDFFINRNENLPTLGQFISQQRSENTSLKKSLFGRFIQKLIGLLNYLNPFYTAPPPIVMQHEVNHSLIERTGVIQEQMGEARPKNSPDSQSMHSALSYSPTPVSEFYTPEDSPEETTFYTPEDSPEETIKPSKKH